MERKVRFYNPRTGQNGELVLLGLPEGVTPEELAAARAALESAIADVEGEIPDALGDLTNDIGAMRYLGANVITDSANDTAVNWIGFGTGYSMFSTTGALMNKPANYGMVLSWVNANNVTQLWITVGGGNAVWKRSGDDANSNPGGWYGGGWKKLAEASELPTKVSDLTNDSGFITADDALVYLGSNPLSDTAHDTPGNWRALGSGFAMYPNSGYLTDQPSSYGYLLNFVKAQFVTQFWIPYGSNSNVFYRYGHVGNASVTAGWKRTWTQLANAADVLPKQPTSETLSFASVSAVGYGYISSMSSSSKVAQVLIPMPNNASDVAITYSGTWTLATDAGTVAISAITVRKVTRAGIHCAVTMNTTLSPTVASPVTLKCAASATMTFTWS